jgi:class 3 adenylate cyclase
VTVFFSDIVGLLQLLRDADAAGELVALMNAYLSAMTDIVEAARRLRRQVRRRFAIVAVFGAPADDPDHARQRRAVPRCACRERLDAAQHATHAAFQRPPASHHRIGLNSGPALVGNIGSRRRFNYTAMGDAVNLASRLEGANKYFGTDILASEATLASDWRRDLRLARDRRHPRQGPPRSRCRSSNRWPPPGPADRRANGARRRPMRAKRWPPGARGTSPCSGRGLCTHCRCSTHRRRSSRGVHALRWRRSRPRPTGSRQHAVHHHAALPQVVGRVAASRPALAVDVLVDLGVFGQQVDQGRCFFSVLAAQVVDQVVRVLAADVGPRPIITASLITRPLVMSMLRRIAAGSTSRPSHHRDAICFSAPAIRQKASGSTIHSISHGPVLRSWSATIASISAAACWRTTLMAAWM